MFSPTRWVDANVPQRCLGRQTRPPKGSIKDPYIEGSKLTCAQETPEEDRRDSTNKSWPPGIGVTETKRLCSR